MRTPRSKPSRLTRMNSVGRALEPGGHHLAVVVPDRAEALPVAGVAPDDPVLDQLANRLPVGSVGHGSMLSTAVRTYSADARSASRSDGVSCHSWIRSTPPAASVTGHSPRRPRSRIRRRARRRPATVQLSHRVRPRRERRPSVPARNPTSTSTSAPSRARRGGRTSCGSSRARRLPARGWGRPVSRSRSRGRTAERSGRHARPRPRPGLSRLRRRAPWRDRCGAGGCR